MQDWHKRRAPITWSGCMVTCMAWWQGSKQCKELSQSCSAYLSSRLVPDLRSFLLCRLQILMVWRAGNSMGRHKRGATSR